MREKLVLSLLLLLGGWLVAQEDKISILAENIPNRLALYAVNESDSDYDVMLTVKGSNFRQSKARPRFVRVPAISKVHMKTLILMRGKQPSYTYDLVVNDSLSNRALRRDYERIKIRPKQQLTIYLTPACLSCDSLLSHISQGKYIIKTLNIQEHPEIREQLQRSMSTANPIDSLTTPIVNLAGTLHTRIETYEQLLEVLDQN